MELEMVVYSDNSMIEQVANILHDNGYKTAGIRKESIGKVEEENEWHWAKLNMLDSVCVDLYKALGQIVPTEQVEEKPLFRYVAIFIVGDDDDDTEDTTEDTEEEEDMKDNESLENVTLNIGMVTRNYMPINVKVAKKIIGLTTDCTITECTGYYKGHEEPSLKVEIYGVSCEKGVDLAHEFARDFNQECVACTVRFKTVFVDAMATMEERKAMTEELKNQ